jgi:hypothetical protein
MEVADRAGSRINIFDGILSDKFTTGTRKSWSSNATTGEYHGKYTTSDTVCKYMSEEIFFHMDTGQHAFVDHASVHMMFKEDTRKMTVEGLMDWVTEQQDADLQILFNNKYEAEGVAEMNQTATRAWLMNWIRDNDLRKRKLVELGKQYDIHVHFLPTGWFETNPVEKIFCHVKPKFRDLTVKHPDWTWQQKLETAYEKVDEPFVDNIIHTYIVWALAKYDELAKDWHGPVQAGKAGKGEGKGGKGFAAKFGIIAVGDSDGDESSVMSGD